MSAQSIKVPVVGGKLKLKGSKSFSGKPSSSSRESLFESDSIVGKKRSVVDEKYDTRDTTESKDIIVDGLTDAQRRHLQKKKQIQSTTIKRLASVSYRERLDKFNLKLAQSTEHNDIPRISAAGNG